VVVSAKVQRRTHYLLGCEVCGRYEEPPKRFESAVARASREPMRCTECGGLLTLLECFIAPQSEMWQAGMGSAWHHVAFPESLPDSAGRQVWMEE
jgi:uncharacterized OB-fold protein